MKEFITIKEAVQAEVIEKKSKFIANFFYVENVQEADEIIKEIKKKYFDARHNCVAYRIIDNEQLVEKLSDDGEPSGTAGAPMLNILQKNNLSNVLIVVTRYFGGILLGTGGLVRAYSDALLKAIEGAQIVKKTLGQELQVLLEYNEFEKFKYYCKNNEINIVNINYMEEIVCNIELEKCRKDKLLEDFETKKIKLLDIKELSKKYINKSI